MLARDIAATVAFLLTIVFIRASAIPARVAGKIVTIGQLLVLLAFLIDSPLFRPLVWLTGVVASSAAAYGMAPFTAVMASISALLVVGALAFVVLPGPGFAPKAR